ncbi:N-acetylmuramoyl-L-alanine amidase [Sediminibacterium sp.]|uniref:N-acetylmuramoyl-L-alanine amidase family protein n=1 Tax=Sediminibacterium sp. TaxID=1917865 RepID=UPI0025F2F1E6|nr:N-acetylmuramoyl-L-alanine amidase [Sediminibacterium sp.]MBW0177366.1 N-acetylmuramoyl-L-alanine amidase [Sediminibacterium sp.]
MMRVKYAAFVLLSFGITMLCSFSSNKGKPQQKQVLRRIIVDAGHGGADIGARGRYSTESQISLEVALKLEKMLQDALPDVEIIMTRKTDIFHSVIQKADIANQAKGDLFVCIHVNSAAPSRHREFVGYKTVKVRRKGKLVSQRVKDYRTWTTPNPAMGTETYIYGIDKTDERKAVASEGLDEYLDSVSVKILEARKKTDANDPTKTMLANILTQQYFQRSAKLAMTIEEEFLKIGRISRKAQQRKKGIWVLQAVNMPAVLVETGFISNPDEEDYLNSEKGQLEICQVVTKAVRIYKNSLENQAGITAAGNRK